jgi:lipoprotein-anchoring transpeptidase ErfK/SrfK
MLNRRSFVALGGMGLLAACASPNPEPEASMAMPAPPPPPLPAFYDAVTDEPFPIPAIEPGTLDPRLWRQEVDNPWPNSSYGTIIIDPDAALLYFSEKDGRATRYGVAVGADGFSWTGTARLQFRREWPRWNVPADTIKRKPELERYSVANGGMAPGPENPMGSRALYLFENGVDTLYRIHGGADAPHLGKAVSSGCIRMLDQDVIHLYKVAVHGCDVVVLPSLTGPKTNALY